MIRLEYVQTVEMYIQTTMIGKDAQNVIVLKANRSQSHHKCKNNLLFLINRKVTGRKST